MCHMTIAWCAFYGDAACETAAFIGTLKSVLRRKHRLLVNIVNNNRKNIYEILLNALFLECKNLSD